MEKPFMIRLHVLSPIHIGCDDVYEPTGFVVDEQKKKLIEFDPLQFVRMIVPQQRNEFSKVCSGDDLLTILKFIKRTYTSKAGGREVEIANGLVEHYKNVLRMSTYDAYGKKAIINQFTMHKTAYNAQTNMPYIPGTSLKGSLRTAYVCALAKVSKTRAYWQTCGLLSGQDLANPFFTYNQIGKRRVSTKLEEKLLAGSFDSDPFRMLKVSDLRPRENVRTKVVYAVNRKKKASDKETLAEKGGVYQIFETLQEGIFEGTLNVGKPERGAGIKLPLTADSLKASINKFYIPLLESEIKALQSIEVSVPIINAINAKFKGQINKTAFLIRIGRHSGAEALTVEDNRNIKVMQGKDKKPKYDDHATTIWLASEEPRPKNNNGLLPFGWAMLEVVG